MVGILNGNELVGLANSEHVWMFNRIVKGVVRVRRNVRIIAKWLSCHFYQHLQSRLNLAGSIFTRAKLGWSSFLCPWKIDCNTYRRSLLAQTTKPNSSKIPAVHAAIGPNRRESSGSGRP